MAKWFGSIGCAETRGTAAGVYKEFITERTYSGDMLSNNKKFQSSENLNDDMIFSNRISIVADPFAFENFPHMRYIVIFGNKWKISNIEINYPRLIITTGGLYNEQTEN